MKSYKVYKIINQINDKVYVGITQLRYLSQRFWYHANRKRCSGAYLHWSIQKYGADNFRIELLEELDTPEKAKEREQFYIALWGLNKHRHPDGNGMNLTDGGDGSYGCKHSAQSIEKMSGVNNHNYGLLGFNNPTSRAVEQWTTDGTYVTTFGSMHEAARTLKPGSSNRQESTIAANIRSSILGRRGSRTAYGFVWRYVTLSPNEL